MKENLTPVMQQYQHLKSQHPNEIMLFRMGDFYELFNEDAKEAAPILEVALTQRQNVPMCGIPFHALDRYLSKLLKHGCRVAVAEQMEDSSAGKGIVQRDVVRVISAGTIIEENLLKEKFNNFLTAIIFSAAVEKNFKPVDAALAAVDISTGQFFLMEIPCSTDLSNLSGELMRMQPAEIVAPEGMIAAKQLPPNIPLHFVSAQELENMRQNHFKILSEAKIPQNALAYQAGQMVLAYIQNMNPSFLQNVQAPISLAQTQSMILDQETIENLELLRNNADGSTARTLLGFLDQTLTAMGGRLLKHWITHPLIQTQKINARLEIVNFLLNERALRKPAQEQLKGVFDLERAVTRISSGAANPRDLIGIQQSLTKIQEIKNIFSKGPSALASPMPTYLSQLLRSSEDCSDVIALIQNAIADNPPVQLDNGGAIRAGFDANLDEKRRAANEGKQWLQNLEAREKQATGIPSLKIGYTSVFGYYLEVTKTHLAKVPPTWHRKQTLLNVERFIHQELKELESKILGAEEQALRMEKALLQKVVEQVRKKNQAIQKSAAVSAELDCLLALAECAELKNLARPEITESENLEITDGWHPMVQESLSAGAFVPNDVTLNHTEQKIIILTGPNMSGKSTYLRQTALIVLMAQLGSFVPAKKAVIGLTDRIFTRIGSGDKLAQGESTFMVEMHETAKILKHATSRSLLILDEVGRGTSTYDGISIAWSIVEHLASKIKAKVLFATHYFELTELADQLEGVRNFNVDAKEWQDQVLFLHKIVPGSADRSYGIHVAQIAGLPDEVVTRAKKILKTLEQEHQSLLKSKHKDQQLYFLLSNQKGDNNP